MYDFAYRAKSIADRLLILNKQKEAIRTSLAARGISIDAATPFGSYAALIASAPSIMPVTYARPADWLAMPTLPPLQTAFKGLLAVFEGTENRIAIQAGYGKHIVDWGDGTVETFSGFARHSYNYAALSDSTKCSRGYKQVIVSVEPHAAADTSILKLAAAYDDTLRSWDNPWLEVKLAAPNLTTLDIVSNSHNWGGLEFKASMLESFTLLSSKVTDFSQMFLNCPSLKNVSMDTSSGTKFAGMFKGCSGLANVPNIPGQNATTLFV